MKKLLIFILALSILFGSCKNQKQIITTDLHETTDSVVKADIIKTNNIKQLEQTEISVVANTVKTDFTRETITITDYSYPDSAGTQTVTRTTTINRNNNIVTDTKIKAETTDSNVIQVDNSFTDKSTTDLKKDLKSKTKITTKEKSKLPVIILWTTIIIVILIMLGLRCKKIFPFD